MFTTTDFMTEAVVVLYNSTVIVPTGTSILLFNCIEIPDIVIAPGIKVADCIGTVLNVTLDTLLSK
jgi:hypothetical protein